MLHTKYKTNSLMRCKDIGFAIPLGGTLALLVAFGMALTVPGKHADYAMALEAENIATYADSNLSFNIGGAGEKEAVKTVAGEVAYRAHTVQVTSTNIKNYSIVINGPVGLQNDSNLTTITGADGKQPSAMADNSWGYAYGQTATPSEMTYSSFTGANQTIDAANTTPNFTKNLVFAVKFGAQASAGHYTGTVTLSITATPKVITDYTLNYDANGGSGAPAVQNYTDDTEAGNHTFTISTTKPTRTGYEFSGWATTSAGAVAYQPGGTITLQASNPTQTLYAVWRKLIGISDIATMQEMTPEICANTETGKTYTLKDTRDANSYTVRKFKDDRCWMTENLRIMGNRTLTSSDSDVTSNYTLPASSISGFSDNTASNAYLSGSTGYYTWCAATAGTCPSSGEASASICPKGWKLPSGGSSGEFNTFASAEGIANSSVGSTKIRGTPYIFAYTGNVYNGTFYDPASYQDGRWWSRTAAYSSTVAYNLYIDDSNVYPGTYNNYRRYGYAVRCVAG